LEIFKYQTSVSKIDRAHSSHYKNFV